MKSPSSPDEHRSLQELLPWYVTGKLDPAEHARVEAHLADCLDCRADVAFQQRLETEIARLPVEVEAGWESMRRRVEAEGESPLRRLGRLGQGRAAWLGWGMAASLALIVGVSMVPPAPQGEYHALAAAPAAAPVGNVVVVFRPDATEADMRGALKAAHGRLVDGPTAADGWVLSVPAGERAQALATLRARHEIVLAEPMDGPS